MVLVGFFSVFLRIFHRIYGREYYTVVGEHKNTSEMKSTWPQLHKTSNIIEKFHLSMKLCWFGKMSIFFQTEIVVFARNPCWPKIWQWYQYIYEDGDLRNRLRGGVIFCLRWCSFLRHPTDPRLYLLQVCIISGKPHQSWVDSSTSTPPSVHKPSEKWTKTSRIRLVKDIDFVHFSDVLWLDGGVGVEESTQDCCGLPEMIHTWSRYNLESVGCLRNELCRKQRGTPPPREDSQITTII